jgi:aryl-alcohol dehydrogenase-like predicted oxidoreductase
VLFVSSYLLRAKSSEMNHKTQGEFYKSSPYAPDIVAATKWCVFKAIEPTSAAVFSAVRERMERMKTHRVDLLQVIYWLLGRYDSQSTMLVPLARLLRSKVYNCVATLGRPEGPGIHFRYRIM